MRLPPYHWWRTVFFLIPAISVYTIVLGAASIVSSLWDRRGYFAHRCARAWSFLILKTTGVRVAVEGLSRVTPGTTYVFVSNHQSIYDTPVLFWSLPFQLRIIAKESLARFPVLGWHLRRGRHLFVDRRHPDRSGILARWRSLVSEGLSLLIFAEGTRSADGHTGRFKGGSFLLAIEAGLPVVPIAVIGTRQVMPKNRLRTEPADVTLVVHDPIPAPVIDRPTARDAKAFADRVRAVVAQTVESRQFSASRSSPSATNAHLAPGTSTGHPAPRT
jgi:1-acyl-sn-glycerol-3-phosphate acyltransferase